MSKRRELQKQVDDVNQVGAALEWANDLIRRGLSAGPVRVSIGRPSRTLDQNARLWAMLGDVSKQVLWHGQKLTAEDFKCMFTASLRRQRAVPNIEGDGFVVLGDSTRRMTIRELSDLMELIAAFGAERGVRWSEPAKEP
jgi:hypothetical protein